MDALKQATFGAVYVIFDDDRWLHASLESVYDECDVILVLIGQAPWNGPARSTDGTIESVKSFPDPDKKITIIRGNWDTETRQRNAGLHHLNKIGIQYCLAIDADEVYDPLELRRMMVFAPCLPEIDCWHISMVTYWKSFRYRIDPPEEFQPPALLQVGKARFVEHRNAKGERHAPIPPHVALMHHLSYARSDKEIWTKIHSFSHASEVQPDWYERVWKGWDADPGIKNLNPAYPGAYPGAVKQTRDALPPVLQRLWNSDSDD
jgi:glycosyltransferase involved in cell wall biosynthesis